MTSRIMHEDGVARFAVVVALGALALYLAFSGSGRREPVSPGPPPAPPPAVTPAEPDCPDGRCPLSPAPTPPPNLR